MYHELLFNAVSKFFFEKKKNLLLSQKVSVRVKIPYSSVLKLSYAINFRTTRAMSQTLVCVHGFRVLLNFVLSAKSAKYTKINRNENSCEYSSCLSIPHSGHTIAVTTDAYISQRKPIPETRLSATPVLSTIMFRPQWIYHQIHSTCSVDAFMCYFWQTRQDPRINELSKIQTSTSANPDWSGFRWIRFTPLNTVPHVEKYRLMPSPSSKRRFFTEVSAGIWSYFWKKALAGVSLIGNRVRDDNRNWS